MPYPIATKSFITATSAILYPLEIALPSMTQSRLVIYWAQNITRVMVLKLQFVYLADIIFDGTGNCQAGCIKMVQRAFLFKFHRICSKYHDSTYLTEKSEALLKRVKIACIVCLVAKIWRTINAISSTVLFRMQVHRPVPFPLPTPDVFIHVECAKGLPLSTWNRAFVPPISAMATLWAYSVTLVPQLVFFACPHLWHDVRNCRNRLSSITSAICPSPCFRFLLADVSRAQLKCCLVHWRRCGKCACMKTTAQA